MLSLNYSLYDCFAEKPFAGHSAAVVEVSKKLESELAKKIAIELCQTATCFVWREKNQLWVESLIKDGESWSINHGLLGVAKHFVKTQEVLHAEDISFDVSVAGDNVSIAVPKYDLALMEMPERLNQAFDVMPVSVREIEKTCVVELRTAKEITELDVDFNRISKLEYDRVVITAEDETGSVDYVYRYFSPKNHVNENSGSLYVQTFLPLFWSERLKKNHFSFLQASARMAVGKAKIEDKCIRIETPVKRIFDGVLKVL